MTERAPEQTTRGQPFARYRRRHGPAPSYSVEPGAVIVAECDARYTLYRVGVVASDGSRYRHLLIVPTNVSAASFDVGLALVEADSVKADAGRFAEIGRLAAALQWNYRQYRAFPPPGELNRFCM